VALCPITHYLSPNYILFYFNLSTGIFELALDFFSIFFGNAFLDRLWNFINQGFGIL